MICPVGISKIGSLSALCCCPLVQVHGRCHLRCGPAQAKCGDEARGADRRWLQAQLSQVPWH